LLEEVAAQEAMPAPAAKADPHLSSLTLAPAALVVVVVRNLLALVVAVVALVCWAKGPMAVLGLQQVWVVAAGQVAVQVLLQAQVVLVAAALAAASAQATTPKQVALDAAVSSGALAERSPATTPAMSPPPLLAALPPLVVDLWGRWCSTQLAPSPGLHLLA
jgi:hypothetical protein